MKFMNDYPNCTTYLLLMKYFTNLQENPTNSTSKEINISKSTESTFYTIIGLDDS